MDTTPLQRFILCTTIASLGGCIEPLASECTTNAQCGQATTSCMTATCVEGSCMELPAVDGTPCSLDVPFDAIALPEPSTAACPIAGAGACDAGSCQPDVVVSPGAVTGEWRFAGTSHGNSTPSGGLTLDPDGLGMAYDQTASRNVTWCAANGSDLEVSLGGVPLQGRVAHDNSAMLLGVDPMSLAFRQGPQVEASAVHGEYSVLFLRRGTSDVDSHFGSMVANHGHGEVELRTDSLAPPISVQLYFTDGPNGLVIEALAEGDDVIFLWAADATAKANVIIARTESTSDGVFVLVKHSDTPPNMRGRWAMALHNYSPGVSGAWFGDVVFGSGGAEGTLQGPSTVELTTLVTQLDLPDVHKGTLLKDGTGAVYLLSVDPTGTIAMGQRVMGTAPGGWAGFGRNQSTALFGVRMSGNE